MSFLNQVYDCKSFSAYLFLAMSSLKYNTAYPKHQPYIVPDSSPDNNDKTEPSPILTKPKIEPVGTPPIRISAGPLLRYTGMSDDLSQWTGSVLIVIDNDTYESGDNTKKNNKNKNKKAKCVSFAPILSYSLSFPMRAKLSKLNKSKLNSGTNSSINADTTTTTTTATDIPRPNKKSTLKSNSKKIQLDSSGLDDSKVSKHVFTPQLLQTNPPIIPRPDSKSRPNRYINKRRPNSSLSCTDYNSIDEIHTNSVYVSGELLLTEYGYSFWKFSLSIPMDPNYETRVDYTINKAPPSIMANTFYIPGSAQNMKAVFYSCNGATKGFNPKLYNGSLWTDVLRHHNYSLGAAGYGSDKDSDRNNNNKYNTDNSTNSKDKDFFSAFSVSEDSKPDSNHYHVLLGGGDQLYCDTIFYSTKNIVSWIETVSIDQKLSAPWTAEIEHDFENAFLNVYLSWMGLGWWENPSSESLRIYDPSYPKALASIPSINIWDDHDVLNGYGSYAERTMNSPVIRGIGKLGYKYYMLFQHHNLPDTDPADEPHWISQDLNGKNRLQLGPYISNISKSVYARLGRDVAFVGIDCRTERTQKQIIYPETYNIIFERLRKELLIVGTDQEERLGQEEMLGSKQEQSAANTESQTKRWPWLKVSEQKPKAPKIKHLYVMLGIPVVFPRLTLAEDILRSKFISPIKRLSNIAHARAIQRKFKIQQQKQQQQASENAPVNKTEWLPTRLLHRVEDSVAGLVNDIDGEFNSLDDIIDRWNSRQHAEERAYLVKELQKIAKEASVRITILSGDIHMGAIGRLSSSLGSSRSCCNQNNRQFNAAGGGPKTGLNHTQGVGFGFEKRKMRMSNARNYACSSINPSDKVNPTRDHRLMLNVISSAITNAPAGQLTIPTLFLASLTFATLISFKTLNNVETEATSAAAEKSLSRHLLDRFLNVQNTTAADSLKKKVPGKANMTMKGFNGKSHTHGRYHYYRHHAVHKLGTKISTALASRLTICSVDDETNEEMINLFKFDVDGSRKINQVLAPRRNWASLVVIEDLDNYYKNHEVDLVDDNCKQNDITKQKPKTYFTFPCTRNDFLNRFSQDVDSEIMMPFSPVPGKNSKTWNSSQHYPESSNPNMGVEQQYRNSFSSYPKYPDGPGAVSVVLHVEKNKLNPNGETRPYELVIPVLEV